MKNRFAPALLAILLVAAPITGQQERPGRLVGSVVSALNGAPISGALIQVLNRTDRTFTNQNGRFQLPRLRSSTVDIQVTSIGHETWTGTVEIRSGEVSTLRVSLQAAPVEVDPVVVLIDRTRLVGDPVNHGRIPGSAQVLTRQDLEADKSAFDNVHDVLRLMPGVNVQEEEGYGLRPNIGLRGTGVERSAKITVLEDGVLAAPAPYTAPSAYYFPTTGRMEAVEVRKGSSQVQYGPRTIGGALNLASSTIPDRTRWAADVAGGQNSTFKAKGRVGGSTDNVGWLLETYQLQTNGFKDLVGGDDTGYRVSDYVGKLRFNTDGDALVYQELELKVGLNDHRSNETYLGLTDEDFRANPTLRYPASQPDVMDADHRLLQARWFLSPSPTWNVTATAYRNDFARNWYKLQSVLGSGIGSVIDDPAGHAEELAILRGQDSEADALKVRANNREYYSQGIQAALGLDLGTRVRHEVVIGARYHGDQEDRFQLEDGYRMSNSAMVLTSNGTPGSQSNRVSDARALAFHVQDDIRVDRWTVSPGVRFETIDFKRTDYSRDDPDRTEPTRVRENHVTAWMPGLAASFEANARTHLFAGVHRGFGPPAAGADPETRPEESVNYEAGARLRSRTGFATSATLFYSDYTNILGTATLSTGDDGSGDQFNGGAADVFGLELAVGVDPLQNSGGWLRLPIRAAYTYTSATFSTSFESDYDPWDDVVEGDEFPYLPNHQYSAAVGVEGLGWGVTLSTFGASAMRTVAGQGELGPAESIDAYAVLNLVAEYQTPYNGTLYLGIQNLLDERYIVARRPAGARPGLTRNLMVGFRVAR
jgi:Fe(3+) dicitrate transport protein